MATSVAEGWEALRVTDRRLKGLSKIEVIAPAGSKVRVLSVKPQMIGQRMTPEGPRPGRFQRQGYIVRYKVDQPDGGSFERSEMVVRPAGVAVDDVEELARYLGMIVPEGQWAQFKDQLEREWVSLQPTWDGAESIDFAPLGVAGPYRAKGGPPLHVGTLLGAMDLVETWRRLDLSIAEPAATVTLPKNELRFLLNLAFGMGAEVREATFPADLSRGSTAAKAFKKSEEAKAWWRLGASWAQQLHDRACEKGANTLGPQALAEAMVDGWSSRPFSPQGPSRLEVNDTRDRLLAIWKAEGWLVYRLPAE